MNILKGMALMMILGSSSASSHDFWSNGEPVPAWVKSYCCGPEDVHHLTKDAVVVTPEGYFIKGLNKLIPTDKALPSQDGDYWAFWIMDKGPDTLIFCFFAPTNGS